MSRSDEFQYGHMSAKEFMASFPPAEYSTNAEWSEVEDHPSFSEPNPINPGRTHAGTMGALVTSLRKDGMKNPVTVDTTNGQEEVTEGHHRVIAAHAAGVPVYYRRRVTR